MYDGAFLYCCVVIIPQGVVTWCGMNHGDGSKAGGWWRFRYMNVGCPPGRGFPSCVLQSQTVFIAKASFRKKDKTF